MKLVRKFNGQLPETNDWFNNFLGRDFFVEPDQYFGTRNNQPKVNIRESEETYQIEVAAPGYQKDEFKVEIDNNILTISVERNNEPTDENIKYSHYEYKYGSFSRSFTLPKGKVQESKIEAQYNNGILTISIPKTEEAKPKPKRILEIQ
ncbi:Hsp20/alpha crystallin family protein [Carboxylicivirga caseinilyticus]|uniref:Hsp20/alpha crystallin family protein n=1 Tax=Carboxylicivirga caseinilyticus TaxID=3417572 RepID=UPI003D34F0B0|nr:Hsp20/alpha crystallin family protein [Marinilabiliaceae bacterium A049]